MPRGRDSESKMNDIHGIHPPTAPKPIESVQAVAHSAPAPEPAGIADTVEISAAARLAAKVHALPDVRAELVQHVKAEIAAGTYETSERIERTVDRLMEELFLG